MDGGGEGVERAQEGVRIEETRGLPPTPLNLQELTALWVPFLISYLESLKQTLG